MAILAARFPGFFSSMKIQMSSHYGQLHKNTFIGPLHLLIIDANENPSKYHLSLRFRLTIYNEITEKFLLDLECPHSKPEPIIYQEPIQKHWRQREEKISHGWLRRSTHGNRRIKYTGLELCWIRLDGSWAWLAWTARVIYLQLGLAVFKGHAQKRQKRSSHGMLNEKKQLLRCIMTLMTPCRATPIKGAKLSMIGRLPSFKVQGGQKKWKIALASSPENFYSELISDCWWTVIEN